MRQALFDILGASVEDVRLLDAFAGTGALGLEALSRGAREVTFVERDREVLAVLRANVHVLGVEERCRILQGEAEKVVSASAGLGPFDLVLADPPYDSQVLQGFLERLVQGRELLAERARVVVEREHRAPELAVSRLALARSVTHGSTRLDFYRFLGPDSAGESTAPADSVTDPRVG